MCRLDFLRHSPTLLKLDACPTGVTRDLRIGNASVLIHLAEQVLTIDELKRATPERLESETESVELIVCELGNRANYVGLGETSDIREALADSIARTRASYDEVHFREVEKRAVIQIDGELERKEFPERRRTSQCLEHLTEG